MTTTRAGALAVVVLAGSQFLAVMSTAVVSVALPAIGAGLHASPAGRLWIVDAYVIVYSALLVVGGTIGGRRCSACCGSARTPPPERPGGTSRWPGRASGCA